MNSPYRGTSIWSISSRIFHQLTKQPWFGGVVGYHACLTFSRMLDTRGPRIEPGPNHYFCPFFFFTILTEWLTYHALVETILHLLKLCPQFAYISLDLCLSSQESLPAPFTCPIELRLSRRGSLVTEDQVKCERKRTDPFFRCYVVWSVGVGGGRCERRNTINRIGSAARKRLFLFLPRRGPDRYDLPD